MIAEKAADIILGNKLPPTMASQNRP